MSFELINATHLSCETLKAQRDERQELRKASEQNESLKNDPKIRSYKATEAVASVRDPRAQEALATVIRKAVNSYDIQGRRLTSYFDEMFTLANMDTTFTNIVEANGISETTDFSVSWREESPNNSAAVAFFNVNYDLPPEAAGTESIRSNTAGTYGNTILMPWVTQKLGEISPLGRYDALASQMKKQFLRMKKFREQKFLVNSEVTSEIVGDVPQWAGFYTDSTLNVSVSAGDLTEALINALHVAIGNPISIDALGIHTGLVALTTPAQLQVVRQLEIAKYVNAESSGDYLANQARLSKMLPGVNLDPDQVVFFKPRLGAVIAFVYAPFFSTATTFAFDPNRPRIVKFKLMDQFGPWIIKREIPELVDQYAVIDFESIVNPNRETRGAYTGQN